MSDNVIKMKKEKKDPSEQLGNFVTKYRRPILLVVIILVVAAIAVCVTVEVTDKSRENGIAKLDSIEYVFTKDSSSLTDEEIASREKTVMDEIQPYLNKKNVVGVRANMLAASIAFQKKDYENSKTYWLAAFASGKKSYTAPVCKYNAAVCCEELGDNTKAAEYYESASDAKDFLLVTHCLFSLGRVKEALNDFTGAAVAYNKLVDKYPDDEWTNVAQSRLIALKTEGKITDAVVEPTDAEKSTDKESK